MKLSNYTQLKTQGHHKTVHMAQPQHTMQECKHVTCEV